MDAEEYAYVPLRAKYTFQTLQNSFNRDIQVLNEWESAGVAWQDLKGKKSTIKGEYLQYHYLDAKRDIQDDIKSRTSYLGKMLGDVVSNYDPEDVAELEQKISSLNAEAIDKSEVLKKIQESLKGIDATMDSSGKVYVSPFAKKLRDLNKSLTIHYGTEDNSFTMDYHGMGTRSWSSMLSFKAFVKQMSDSMNPDEEAFLPIIAIEEPESHLHPNAQKQLYRQMNEMPGIKIISTHSPYVAACAELSELRGLYKSGEKTICGQLPITLDSEDQRRIKQAVLMSNGELLYRKRQAFVDELVPLFQQIYQQISGDKEQVRLHYVSHCQRGPLLDVIQRDRFKDRAVGYSLHGVHRDDLEFLLGDYPMKREGSQGQNKTFVIALKLAQFTFLQRTSSNTLPLLLLDDIFDKLDAQRVEAIVKLVAGDHFGQIFITDTNRDHLDKILQNMQGDHTIFYVENGEIIK